VGFRDVFRQRGRELEPALKLHFEERDWESENESGEHLDGRGYGLRDERGHALAWDDPLLAAGGIEAMKVAGTSHRVDVVQDDAFASGSRLLLRPDPGNRFDENAIGVWDADGRLQAGYVPAHRAEELGHRLRSEKLEALCLWEWRDSSGRRCGLRMLVCPPSTLAHRPPPRRDG
jgi:hypothetical protein